MSELFPNVRFHQVQPSSIKSTYTEYDNVDFLIACGAGRSLVRNSVRIIGDLEIQSAAGVRANGNILFDNKIGAHSFIESLQITTSQQGVVENINNSYARYVGLAGIASFNELDYCNAKHSCELKAPNEAVMIKYANGIAPFLTTASAVIDDVDFSIKPMCALNKMTGGDLPFNRSGTITLTTNLARNMSALYGIAQDNASLYLLKNLRCTFNSVPDSKTPSTVQMRTIHPVKSNILSGNASVSANVNAVCDAVSICVLQQTNENVPKKNNYACENIKEFDQVSYLFNNQSNSLITYQIRDQTEVLERFISSMYNTGHNQVSLSNFRANGGFGLGLDFDGLIDLSRNRFTMELQSGVGSGAANTPYVVWLYFHSQTAI